MKSGGGIERTDPIWREVLLSVNSCYRETVCERKSGGMAHVTAILLLEMVSHQPSATPPPPNQSAAINIEARPAAAKRLGLAEGSGDGQHCSAMLCFYLRRAHGFLDIILLLHT